MRTIVAVLLWVVSAFSLAGDAQVEQPVLRQRADPFAMLDADGWYYFTATVPEYDRIELRRTRDLNQLASAETRVVWRQHAHGEMGAHIWAPELHRIGGKWYVYFSAGKAEHPWEIAIYVLENAHANPLEGEWTELGRIDTGWSGFALDATTFALNHRRYLVWAQSPKPPATGKGTNIYIAEMASPVRLAGPAVMLSRPEFDWEKIGHDVNEGPAVLVRHGQVFLTYSASATDAHYALGMLNAAADADLLDPRSWRKSARPVFSTDEGAQRYGPGHNSFVTTPDGKTDLLVYHARSYRDIQGDPLNDPNRDTRVKAIRWRADGTPEF